MSFLHAVPLTAFIKLVADLHLSLCHLSNMLALTPRLSSGRVRCSACEVLLPRSAFSEIYGHDDRFELACPLAVQ